LNSLVIDAFRCASLDRWQILWATGPRHFEAVSTAIGQLPANLRLVAYIDDMPSALACADLAVSRAGAMTTSEFLAWGLPSVLVPLPSAAADHQRRNASALETAGVSVVLEEETTTGDQLGDVLSDLGADRSRLTEMAKKALGRARPQAVHDIATAVASLLPPADSEAA